MIDNFLSNRRVFFILFIILFSLIVSNDSFSEESIKTVVVFYSLDHNLPAYRTFQEGLNGHYATIPDRPYSLIVEYLELNTYPHKEDIESIVQLHNEKYKAVNIDLLITFGPGAYEALKKYGFEPINHTPVVNIEIESNIYDINGGLLFDDENALHISIKTDYKETIGTAIKLFPDYHDVYIISGSSPADRYFAELTRQGTEQFSQSHNFTFYNGLPLDSILSLVRKIPESSIVFTTSFMEDSKKIPFSTSMVVRILAAECNAPHFTLSDDFIEEGLIGGYVYSFIELGRQTEKIAEEVLNGRSIKEITVDENGFNKHMYNWHLLKKWGLLESKVIPADSVFFNQKMNFFSEYKWYLFGGLLFLIGQTLLILFLVDLNKRQKAVAKQRTENEQLFRELARQDRLSRMSELTASLSHELNQPLTAILYNAQAGKRFIDTGNLSNKQALEILNNIIEDDKRAGSLISSVRSLMKLEEREKEKVDLNSIILETEKLFHSESIAKHIQISLKLEEQPVFVFGDKIQLQQVMLNFLFNAANSLEEIDFKSNKIEVCQQIEDDQVIVTVRDSGPGINPEIEDKLFKPFVTSTKKGLGIGLAVSRSIIEAHNGEISAKNISTGGAEFSFKLQLYNDKK